MAKTKQVITDGETIYALDISQTPPGSIGYYWLHLLRNGIGEPIRIPIMVARGQQEGPVLGLTAAIHGNEFNGIPIIQHLFKEIDVQALTGTIVGVLVLNVPGVLREQRAFNDDVDLNRIAPGKIDGDRSELYVHRLVERILQSFDYLIDLHTATFGNVNSWYVRADLSNEAVARMAHLQNPEIILNSPPKDSTWRGAAAHLGIKAITLKLKNPYVFQPSIIEEGLVGIRNVLYDLKMLEGKIECTISTTIQCQDSYWIYSDEGGILKVLPDVKDFLQKGQLMAEVRNIFGKLIKQYVAPQDGIVLEKSVNPINQSGSRILHLGIQTQQVTCLHSF